MNFTLNKNILYPLFETALKRDITSKVNTLNNFAKLSQGEVQVYQKKALHKVLTDASVDIPYYSKLFKSIRFNPDSILKDRKYFDDIPFLTKQIIQANPQDFVSKKFDKNKIIRRKTNGSTGPTLTTLYCKESLDWTSAINRHVQLWTNHQLDKKECYLYTVMDPEPKSFSEKAVEDLKCLALNRENLKLKDLENTSLQEVFNSLKKLKPYLLQAHPTILCALAHYLNSQKISGGGLFEVFESTGETLTKERHQLIRSTFNCKIVNRYGNAEFGVVAYSQDENPYSLKTVDYSVIIENFIYGNGIPEIVITGLLNPVMPYIKYRTGDIGEVFHEENGTFLKNISGRVHDLFTVNEKKFSTSNISDLFDKTGGVDDFQLIRYASGDLQLNIALNDERKKKNIEEAVNQAFGSPVKISFINYSSFLRVGWRDKFKSFIVMG